jgi:hypothetical protein
MRYRNHCLLTILLTIVNRALRSTAGRSALNLLPTCRMKLALGPGGETDQDDSHFMRCMNEVKSKRMTYVEGLQ